MNAEKHWIIVKIYLNILTVFGIFKKSLKVGEGNYKIYQFGLDFLIPTISGLNKSGKELLKIFVKTLRCSFEVGKS